ncbi:MAG: hypothetical protein ABI533_06060 [Betaproteobacteria bacterium]
MTMDPPRYWFPAKRYGWGWGLPTAWQGWGVIAGYASLVVVGIVLVPPGARIGLFLVYIVAITILLIGICWAEGEPPRWRWGKRTDARR